MREARIIPAKLALVLLLAVPAWVRAAEVPWLYEVEVPVADQSAEARLDAASRALAELLIRLTGLASVPRNDQVSRALEAPDLYYNQFRFEHQPANEGGETGDGQLMVRLQFMAEPVLDLIRDAGLPIWRSNRPTVLVWIVVDDGNERRILAADSENPVVKGITERARERGVPLQLPLMDLTDQLAVEPAAVWGRLGQILEPASRRYGADVLLVGRLQSAGDEHWSASWELWVDGDVRDLDQEARDPAALGRAAGDLVADELAGRYAVLDRGVRRIDLVVEGVSNAADYAGLLRYLGGLEFIQSVSVSGVIRRPAGGVAADCRGRRSVARAVPPGSAASAGSLRDAARVCHRAGVAETLVLAALPNVITVVRIGMVVPIAWLLWRGDYVVVLILTGVAGASDAADGWLARRLGAVSQLGAALDPVADKLLVVSIFVICAAQGHLPVWLAAIVLGRDVVIMCGAGVYRLLFGHIEFSPTYLSKANTAVQIAMALLVLLWLCGFGAISRLIGAALAPYGFYLLAALGVASGLDYVITWSVRAWREARSAPGP